VFVASQPRPLVLFPCLTPTSCPVFSKSFPLNLFADPHPLTPIVSILYKNIGRGTFLRFQRSNVQPSNMPAGFALNSHGITSFADSHPITRLKSYRFKNIAGALLHSRAPRFAERARLISTLPKSFICNTCGPSRKCCKQRTYTGPTMMLSSLHATLTKNTGGGSVIVN